MRLDASLVLLLSMAMGCAGARLGPPDLPDAGVPDLETRSLLLLFADRRTFEPFVAQQALAGPPDLREAMAHFLGRTGLPEARGYLEGLRVDDVPAVRRAAIFALGSLGDGEARPALLASAAAVEREEAVLAVEALAKLGTPLGNVLLALLPLPEEERWRRLLPALHRFEGTTLSALARKGLEEAADAASRRGAVLALARTASPADADLLEGLLGDGDPIVRSWAAGALGEVGAARAAERLVALLADADDLPRAAAMSALRRLAERDALPLEAGHKRRLAAALGDPSPGVRLAALEAVPAWLPHEETIPILRERLADGVEAERGPALGALLVAEPGRRGEFLAAAAKSPVVPVRAAAARLGSRDLAAALRDDPAPVVRALAHRTMLQDERVDPEARRALLADGLTDLDAGVRAAVLEWLSERPVLPFEPIEASLALARSDGIPDARLAAVRALVARGLAEPLDRGSVVRRLESLADDPDRQVRREAAGGLARLDRPAAEPRTALLGRGGEVYRQIIQQTARPRRVELRTSRGAMLLELPCALTPLTCLNFLQLAARGFYDGLEVSRLVPGGWLETGDPRGDGRGGPGYTLRDEINPMTFAEGVVGMASETPDGAGSRLLFALAPLPDLDGRRTAFGRIVRGLEVLRRLAPGDRIESVRELAER